MSPETAVMLRPAAAYRRLASEWPLVHPVAALRRPALAALVAGAAVSLTATGRVTAALLVSTTLYWSFALAWQLLIAILVMRTPGGTLTTAQRVDLFFAGHAPWSLWLLAASAWTRAFPEYSDLYILLCTAAIPGAWTSAIVYGFCTGALALDRGRAVLRTLLHQGLIYLFAFVYIAWAVALWARASGLFTR